MRRLVAAPPANFVSANKQAFAALGVTRATFTAGRIVQSKSGDRASARVIAHYQLPHVGAFTPRTTRAARQARRPLAGVVVHAHDQPPPGAPASRCRCSGTGPSARRSSAPAACGSRATATRWRSASSASASSTPIRCAPTWCWQARPPRRRARRSPRPRPTRPTSSRCSRSRRPVSSSSRPRGPHNVYAVPGTQFELQASRHAITAQLSDQLVGAVGPITADQLKQLGSPYDSTSIVGQRGLEQVYERRLAGTPTTEVAVADSTGARRTPGHLPAGRAGGPPRASTRASSGRRRRRSPETPITSPWSRCGRRPARSSRSSPTPPTTSSTRRCRGAIRPARRSRC